MANVFRSTFLNVFLLLPRFSRFLTFFLFFLERFFTSMHKIGQYLAKLSRTTKWKVFKTQCLWHFHSK